MPDDHPEANFESPASPPVEASAVVVGQSPMARDMYRMRLRCPEIARRITPGQFFMLRAERDASTLLGRPFALFDTADEGGRCADLELGYVAVGKLTRLMTDWSPGTVVRVWGPLGNGFAPQGAERLLMVAGGVGVTPFLAVARERAGLKRYGRREPSRPASGSTALLFGCRSAAHLPDLAEFTDAGVAVKVATDDGSAGTRGFVTELLRAELLDGPAEVLCCGPEPMMKAVAELCDDFGAPCRLSLESPMACGYGACFSCVVRVRTVDGWDYRRSCVEGPVFRSRELML